MISDEPPIRVDMLHYIAKAYLELQLPLLIGIALVNRIKGQGLRDCGSYRLSHILNLN